MNYLPFLVTWEITTPQNLPPDNVHVLVTDSGKLSLKLAYVSTFNGHRSWTYIGGDTYVAPAFWLKGLIAPDDQICPIKALEKSNLWQYVTPIKGQFFFRQDTDDVTVKENENLCFSLQEELRAIGWEIDDPCIEHDCISGNLKNSLRTI